MSRATNTPFGVRSSTLQFPKSGKVKETRASQPGPTPKRIEIQDCVKVAWRGVSGVSIGSAGDPRSRRAGETSHSQNRRLTVCSARRDGYYYLLHLYDNSRLNLSLLAQLFLPDTPTNATDAPQPLAPEYLRISLIPQREMTQPL